MRVNPQLEPGVVDFVGLEGEQGTTAVQGRVRRRRGTPAGSEAKRWDVVPDPAHSRRAGCDEQKPMVAIRREATGRALSIDVAFTRGGLGRAGGVADEAVEAAHHHALSSFGEPEPSVRICGPGIASPSVIARSLASSSWMRFNASSIRPFTAAPEWRRACHRGGRRRLRACPRLSRPPVRRTDRLTTYEFSLVACFFGAGVGLPARTTTRSQKDGERGDEGGERGDRFRLHRPTACRVNLNTRNSQSCTGASALISRIVYARAASADAFVAASAPSARRAACALISEAVSRFRRFWSWQFVWIDRARCFWIW